MISSMMALAIITTLGIFMMTLLVISLKARIRDRRATLDAHHQSEMFELNQRHELELAAFEEKKVASAHARQIELDAIEIERMKVELELKSIAIQEEESRRRHEVALRVQQNLETALLECEALRGQADPEVLAPMLMGIVEELRRHRSSFDARRPVAVDHIHGQVQPPSKARMQPASSFHAAVAHLRDALGPIVNRDVDDAFKTPRRAEQELYKASSRVKAGGSIHADKFREELKAEKLREIFEASKKA